MLPGPQWRPQWRPQHYWWLLLPFSVICSQKFTWHMELYFSWEKMRDTLLTILRELKRESEKQNKKQNQKPIGKAASRWLWMIPSSWLSPMIEKRHISQWSEVKRKLYWSKNCGQQKQYYACSSGFLFWERCYVCNSIKPLVSPHEAILEGHLLKTPEGDE